MYDFIEYNKTNLLTATSYISVATLKAINTNNIMINFTDITAFTDAQLENQLINATQILDNLMSWNGFKQDSTQRLEFPRDYEVDYVLSDDIQLATAYICANIANGTINTILVVDSGIQVKKEKADVLEKEYFQATSSTNAAFANNPYLENLLYNYIGGGSMFINVNKG